MVCDICRDKPHHNAAPVWEPDQLIKQYRALAAQHTGAEQARFLRLANGIMGEHR